MRWAVAILTLMLAASAMAQMENANPVLAHYREYRAAMERDDLVAAETAAEAALAASEARDGDGGRTAVLAMNLAHVRLDRGRASEALAPARRAHDIAVARAADSGVDPLAARLALGRAELAESGSGRETRLLGALTDSQTRRDLDVEAYAAANALGLWAFANEHWEMARIASVALSRHAEGAPLGAAFGRADARLSEGAALILMRNRDQEAHAAIVEALEMYYPFAEILSPDGAMTVAQSRYAEAMAWRGILIATSREDFPRWDDLNSLDKNGDPLDLSPRCDIRVIPRPLPRYPERALERRGAGAVVLRLRIDASGAVVDRQIAAAVPRKDFFDSVARVMDRWRVERAPESTPNCSMDMIIYQLIRFGG